MFPVNVRDPGTGEGQRVTANGESVNGLLAYSEPFHVQLNVDNQIFNVVPGIAGKRIVMTGILVATTRNIVNEKLVEIYEATTTTTGVSAKDIVSLDMQKSERVYLPLVNVSALNGNSVNANAEDSEVDITIFAYYITATGA